MKVKDLLLQIAEKLPKKYHANWSRKNKLSTICKKKKIKTHTWDAI